jgi:hypothetical protein
MRNLPDQLKKIIPFLTNKMLTEASSGSFDFIRSKKEMLKEFEYCLRERNLVGVYCPLLGNGMFLVGVENIVSGDEGSLIIFYSLDMSGHALSRRTLHVDEISMIVPFNNPFIPPIHVPLQRVQEAC